ncbi:copper-translocating P-type ATPase [Alkalicoccus luteus]|uniref:copper-translocating P-type ATPase n=1 Tax=Alkalicoccus luteus TaxID=1237094 RepID=UPI004034C0DC
MEHHQGHEHNHQPANHANHLNDFKHRFYVSAAVMVPILALSPMIQEFLGQNWRFPFDMYILFLLSSFVYFYGGWPFLKGIVSEMRDRNPGMMTLISLAISVAYFYSTAVVFGVPGHEMYWELSTLIVIMLLGHWIEMKSIAGASSDLEELVRFMPSSAHLLQEDGTTVEVKASTLTPGQRVLVKPGEKVPVDGTVAQGRSDVDESAVTGESVPVYKEAGDSLIGGSINSEGALTVVVEKTGQESYLSQVIKLVQEAQESKSRTQDLANRAAKFLFYVAVIAGVLTLSGWLAAGFSTNFAIERMVTVMVIACPHALGLAAPLVTAVSTSLSAKKGLLIRNRTSFEEARYLNAVLFDKTGTLTKGEFGITDVIEEHADRKTILYYASSLESSSAHPIAQGIVRSAEEEGINYSPPEEVDSLTGKGLSGRIQDKQVLAVSPGYMRENKVSFHEATFQQLSSEGKTVIFLIVDDVLYGMIALADQVREDSKEAVRILHQMGIEAMMVTGDNRTVAQWVGKELGLDQIYAEVLPHEKAEIVEQVQRAGKKTAMTGDGVNDAPALAVADLGIAIGAGTDVAVESADVVLVRSNPLDVAALIRLSRSTYRKMIQNLWWAAGYNIIALPLAAGILYQAGILLTPAVGAVLMSVSTIIVAINAKLLKSE